MACDRVDGMDSEDSDSDSDVGLDTGLFNSPRDVVVSGDGALWVAEVDMNNHRLCLHR